MKKIRTLLVAASCLSLARCDAPSTPAGGAAPVLDAPAFARAPQPALPGDQVLASGGGQVAIARVEGYGNPVTGELWMRTVEPGQPSIADGVGVQSHELGYCKEQEGGAGVRLSTKSVPGCEDADSGSGDVNGDCDRTLAFDETFCLLQISTADDTAASSSGYTHAQKFSNTGVACAGQRITNNGTADLTNVYLDYDSFNGDPSQEPLGWPFKNGIQNKLAGRGAPHPDKGLYAFGDIDAGDTSSDVWIFFKNGATTDFTFTGFIYAEYAETDDGSDEDCDGVVDNGLGEFASGASCYADNDCESGTCTGEAIVSLAGAAAGDGTSLSDDQAGTCGDFCGDDIVSGDEECDGTADCDGSCNVLPGYLDPGWGPVTGDVSGASSDDVGLKVIEDSNANLLVAGATSATGDADWFIARVLPNGAGLDTSFHGDGYAETVDFSSPDPAERPACIAELGDASIMLAGSIQGGQDIGVARWDASGNLLGSVEHDLWDGEVVGDCVAVGNQLLVLATTHNGLNTDVRLIMLDADGGIDAAWGVGSPNASGVTSFDAIAGSLIADGQTITVDGSVLEFDSNSTFTNTRVVYTGGEDAPTMAGIIAAAINGYGGISAAAVGSTVTVVHQQVGTTTLSTTTNMIVGDALGGSMLHDVSSGTQIAVALARNVNGEILVAMDDDGDVTLAKYSAGGIVLTVKEAFLLGATVSDLAVSGEVPVISANSSGTGRTVLMDKWFSLDTGYAGTGVRTESAGDRIDAVAWDGSGRIVTCGQRLSGPSMRVARVDTAGAPDIGFHPTAGELVNPGADGCSGLAFATGGGIMALGSNTANGNDWYLAQIRE